MNRITTAAVPVLVLLISKEFGAEFRPSTVTLSAPFKSMRGPAIEPAIVRAPLGVIVRLVHKPPEGWFNTAEAVSVVFLTMETAVEFPVWFVFAFKASNAALSVT